MSISVNNIINRALRIIRAEGAFSDTNYDARQYALDSLNDILFLMNATGTLLPYQNQLEFSLEAGKHQYTLGTPIGSDVVTVAPIIALDYVNLIINQYEYPIEIEDNFAIYSNIVTPQIVGRPREVLPQFRENQLVLTFYPTPDRVYTCRLTYKPELVEAQYQTNIDLPLSYRSFLTYQLAKKINIEEGIGTWGAEAEQEFQRMMSVLKGATQKDNRVRSVPPIRHFYNEFTYYLGVVR